MTEPQHQHLMLLAEYIIRGHIPRLLLPLSHHLVSALQLSSHPLLTPSWVSPHFRELGLQRKYPGRYFSQKYSAADDLLSFS